MIWGEPPYFWKHPCTSSGFFNPCVIPITFDALNRGQEQNECQGTCHQLAIAGGIHDAITTKPLLYTQEVQLDQTLPIGRIGNPESMDHPKDQPLCLVLDSQGIYIYCHAINFLQASLEEYSPVIYIYISDT